MFTQDGDRPELHGWRVTEVEEMTPEDTADFVFDLVGNGAVDVIVYEIFRLYGDRAMAQTGSQFETAQVIGAIKWLVRSNFEHWTRHQEDRPCPPAWWCTDDQKSALVPVSIFGQRADIKKPTTGILRSLGVPSVAKERGVGGHCKDAELHGWYHILHG